MNLVIEDNFIELQREATHMLVQQKVLISERERVDNFLDKVNEIKISHTKLITDYKGAIEIVVAFLEKSQTIEELVSVAESINNLVSTTARLIQSFGDNKLKDCFITEMATYNVLLDDINDISTDIQNRIACDSEMMDLLDNL